MGEYADLALNGDVCEFCFAPFVDSGGFGIPRACTRCVDSLPRKKKARTRHVRCPACARTFHSEFALEQHRAAKAH